MGRLLFLATGGTFGMIRRPGSDVLEPATDLSASLPSLRGQDQAQIDAEIVANLDSSDMTPALWEALGRRIYDGLGTYDGFVILHGTDTMAYTAAALSYMLENLPRPVILTGSQRPLAEPRSDAEANLLHSTHCALLDLPEVGLYFGNTLYRGNRATKTSIQSYHAYSSPNFPPLLEMGVDVVRPTPHLQPRGAPAFHPGFCTDVAVLQPVPGQRPFLLDAARDAGARAVVVRAFGEGNLPLVEWPEAVGRATAAGVPVIIASQAPLGRIQAGRYRNSARCLDQGALFTGDMTLEAAVVKAMWLLGQGLDLSAFRARFGRSVAGELTE